MTVISGNGDEGSQDAVRGRGDGLEMKCQGKAVYTRVLLRVMSVAAFLCNSYSLPFYLSVSLSAHFSVILRFLCKLYIFFSYSIFFISFSSSFLSLVHPHFL